MPTIHFLGAAGTVTGSRHLIEHAGRRVLLDCGLFQGEKALRLRNWEPFPVPPEAIDAVVLSHAHIDHTGWLPRLVRDGFAGPVYCTPATADLCGIMLPDSGRIQEEDADYANRKRYSRHDPALPLYTEEDARACLPRLRTVSHGVPTPILDGFRLTFHRAGHILGSAVVTLDLEAAGATPHRVVFSGDLGRYGMPIIPDPEPVDGATTLLVECTYGHRLHEEHHPREALGRIVAEVVARRGVLLVPAFAIGRTQDLLYHLGRLQAEGAIPAPIPIYVDSPMASDATPLYLQHREEHDAEMAALLAGGKNPLRPERVHFTRSVQESKALNERRGPLVIISASGMATGGRILHHLRQRLPQPETTVLFVGYQAAGTRGRRLLAGEERVRMHGQEVPVRATISEIRGFSAHADHAETDRWLAGLSRPPQRTFCVHGEPDALRATRDRLAGRGWSVEVPAYRASVPL